MRRLLWPVLFLILALVSWSPGEPPPHAVPGPSIEQWIEQLGSKEFAVREAAIQALTQRGPLALTALRKARDHADAEVRRRVSELLPTLGKSIALTPKRVSMRLSRQPLNKAVDEIVRQTGYKIEVQPDPDHDKQVYDFHFDQVTFWEALDQVCESADLMFQGVEENDNIIRLYYQNCCVPFIYRSGPFRFSAQSFQYNRSIDFSLVPRTGGDAGQRTENLNFMFNVATEPKLALLGVGSAKLHAAYDDGKLSMLPDPPEGSDAAVQVSRYGNGYRSFMMQVAVGLKRPSKKSRTMKLLRGTLPVTLLVEQKPEIVIDKILKAKGKKFNTPEVAWEILDVGEAPENGPGSYKVKMTIKETRKDKNDNGDNSWSNSLHQRIEMQDAKGLKYQFNGVNWEKSDGSSVEGWLFFGDPGNGVGPPEKLTYSSWTTMQHQVDFEFKDLPLP